MPDINENLEREQIKSPRLENNKLALLLDYWIDASTEALVRDTAAQVLGNDHGISILHVNSFNIPRISVSSTLDIARKHRFVLLTHSMRSDLWAPALYRSPGIILIPCAKVRKESTEESLRISREFLIAAVNDIFKRLPLDIKQWPKRAAVYRLSGDVDILEAPPRELKDNLPTKIMSWCYKPAG